MEGRVQGPFYCRAVCNTQKMPVRLFNSIVCLRFFMRARGTFCYIIRVMIHQPRTSFFESHAGELLLEMKEALKLRERIAEIYAQRTGNPTSIISRDMDRDVFFSARQARIYGIIDDIEFSDDEELLRG
jgi:hypothetical protein